MVCLGKTGSVVKKKAAFNGQPLYIFVVRILSD